MPAYSPRIVQHFSDPQNVGELENPDVIVHIGNPACGDQIYLYARITQNHVTACSFLAYGCAASLATASILTEEIQGRSLEEIEQIDEAQIVEFVGGLAPSQRHCATIGHHALRALVHQARGNAAPEPNPRALTC